MNEHFFADVDLPFHVWVREHSVGPGFRWVLREASHLQQNGSGVQSEPVDGDQAPDSESSN